MTDDPEARVAALRLIEAIIFASPAPVTVAALAERLPDAAPVEALLDDLVKLYRFRGINLVAVAGGFAFRTAADLAGALTLERRETRRLSRAQIETLAIVAYHQPVTRAEIEEIRGVTLHKGTLDLLLETGWIQPKGRRDSPGRPVTWVTTETFLQHFGLDSLKDLPNQAELAASGLLDARPVETLGERGESTASSPDEEL
jgi:segregation and condensation protein B